MAEKSLVVFARLQEDFVPAGRLVLNETAAGVDASTFAYGTRYLERPGAFEVDPVSLSIPDRQAARGMRFYPRNGLTQFGGVRDCAPDAWGRRVIEARKRVPANSLPESTYLLEAGSDRIGALDVRNHIGEPATEGVGVVRSLQYMLDTVERIERGEPVPAHWTDLFGSGPGAGGARPKASVRDETGLLWLAKFPSVSDTFDVALAEWATLRLARLCGMTVPEARTLDLGGRNCLLVRRFDRYWSASAEPTAEDIALHETVPRQDAAKEFSLPFVSGLTFVGCDEMESRLKGYDDLARAIRSYAHPSVIRADNRELFTRMVFNILVSNDDDHLRNHAFVRDPRLTGWRLSPLYDVVPRPGVAFERFLHLQVGDEGKAATLDNALTRCAAFTLDRAQAVNLIADVWSQVVQWRANFEAWRLPGKLVDQLAPAMRRLDEVASPKLQRELARG